jgi:CheY-like chemotaxis protein
MPRILLIEDEVVLRSMMARGLGRTPGYEVLDAGTLEDGVRLLDGHGIDLVVSDIDLPGRSGIELLAELSARGLRVPVVFVSGYLGHYAAQIPHHEDLEVLEKPVSIDELRHTIERRLTSSRPRMDSAPFGVPDFLQLASMGRHSVIIEVEAPGEGSGAVVVSQGQVWAAADGHGSGEAALRRLAFLPAEVSCRRLVGPPGERNVERDWEWVLLDEARSLDESGRGALARRSLRPSAPPSDEVSWAGLEVPTPAPPPTKPSSHLDVPPSRARPEPPHASAREREPEPSRRLREPRVASSREPPPRDDGFELAWDEGVGALLRKDYHAALEAFLRARAIRPDDTKVTVNLRRLAELGVSEAS